MGSLPLSDESKEEGIKWIMSSAQTEEGARRDERSFVKTAREIKRENREDYQTYCDRFYGCEN